MGVGKSTFAFSNTSITQDGGSTTIGITRDNQSYNHKLSHGYGQFAALPVGDTQHVWTPTAQDLIRFWQEVPSQRSRLVDVYLDTYNGNTLVGRDTHALTINLSENTGKPTITGFTITDSTAAASSRNMILIGKSSLTASSTITPKYGASIANTAYIYNGSEYATIGEALAAIPATLTPTDYMVGVKATDTRGFATTSTLTKKVAKYVNPEIERFEVIRCDSSGTETASGTKAKVIIEGSWAHLPVSGTAQNTATLKVGYKLASAQSYTYTTISVSNGSVDIEQIMEWTCTVGSDYMFSVELEDGVGGSSGKASATCSFSNDKNIIYVSPDGETLSFDAHNIKIGDYRAAITLADEMHIESSTVNGFTGSSLLVGDGFLDVGVLTSPESQEGQASPAVMAFYGMQVLAGVDGYVSINHDYGGSINLNNSGVGVTGQFSLNLIQYSSGDCGSYDETGIYYIRPSVTGKPSGVDRGWLISARSDDFVSESVQTVIRRYQRFISIDGSEYTRIKTDDTWGEWTASGGGGGGSITLPLSIANGGTGATTASAARTNLGVAASSHNHSASNITSGTLSVSRGGTGQTTAKATRNALGLGNTTGALPIANGGTGSTSASAALSALGGASYSVLYDNASGATDVTLSENYTNYQFLDVYFSKKEGSYYSYGCARTLATSTRFPMIGFQLAANNSTWQQYMVMANLRNNNQIKLENSAGYFNLNGNDYDVEVNVIKVYKVIGWK